MKLAEALMERADLQRRLVQIRERIKQNAIYQEGETPAESVVELLAEYRRCAERLETLVVAINRSNQQIVLADGTPLLEALVRRDGLIRECAMLIALCEAAMPDNSRYSRSELRYVSAVNIADIRKEADKLAQNCRQLDILVQQANWSHELN